MSLAKITSESRMYSGAVMGWHYYLTVTGVDGEVIFEDDARGRRGWSLLMKDAARLTQAASVVEDFDHRLRPWAAIVDEGGV